MDYVFKFLERFPDTNTIIVNGGDPLMMPPEYYWNLIEWLDEREYKTTISFTSNLWDFYKNPDRWTDLFNNERMGVTTSFNYGDTRRITKYRIFTEEDFWNISDLMLERCGYRPDFISVINNDNEDTAIDNVLLAQRMDVECKLNYAMASGDQYAPYQLSKIYQMYVEIAKRGLTQWEYNTKQMIKRLNRGGTSCPQNRDCDAGIRSINPRLVSDPSGQTGYYSCGAFDDDNEKPINFVKEIVGFGDIERPLQNDISMDSMHAGCYTCPMFKICNGCKKTIKDHKQHDMVDDHCALMKTLSDDIVALQE
jgi:MoaA/NifB/PqqE/SkfB family radical SAM enzyme